MSVKRKITFLLASSTLFIALIGISLGYYLGKNILIETIGKEHKQIASILGLYITETLKGEIEDAETYATRPLWISAVKESNLKYADINKKDIVPLLLDMDKKWIPAGNDSPLLKEYLGNIISMSMQDIVRIRKTVSEIFITDKFGGLVAASDKTSDFYQADEEWWQEAYDKGKGKTYVGDVGFDESSKSWSVPIAVPMKDEAGEVIGICKVVVELERLVSGLRHFTIGNTGHAVLVDKNGSILVHYGLKPMTLKYYDGNLNDILNEKKSYTITSGLHTHHKEKIFAAFSKIDLTSISRRIDHWIVFIDQDSDETLKPIRTLIDRIVFVASIIMLLVVPIGYIVGSIFVKPIEKLREATENILSGNWDYKIDLKTGDEIEEFADSFKEMRRKIKENQDALLSAKNSLEELSKNLEKKVSERTKDLSETQEATLNVLEDLTEAKNSLEKRTKELEDALRIKSDFTSMVSHELRTPLAAIKESISLILDGMAGDVGADQRDFLNMAKRNVDRLARLINEILDFQKLESNKMVFVLNDNDINEVAREVGSSMATLTKERNIELILDLSDDLPMLRFDRDKIVQVLTNLIDNAFKFTEKGSITIASAPAGEDVLVSVSDTGVGIKKEDFSKLFQQFEQLEKGGTRKAGGTGLGLAISKQIVEKHGGKIWIESHPGTGTTFYFTLPTKC